MLTLLIKIFIKEKENVKKPEVRTKYGMLCSIYGIFLNLLLFTIKFIAGTLSASIAITADAFNNLSDAGSSIISMFGFKLAGEKPDPKHPFGHGRIEYIAGLFVSVAILLMGIELVKSSYEKIIHPSEIVFSPLIFIFLIVSILVKFYMAFYSKRIGAKIESPAMLATATDSLSDTISTFVVLLATIISHFAGIQIDGYAGLVVGVLICYAGISSIHDTIDPLLGTPPTKEFVDSVVEIVMSYPEIVGVHDLIVHDYGPGRLMITLHAEVPDIGDIRELHDVIDNAEAKLMKELNCHAVIHMDPVTVGDIKTDTLKEMVLRIISEMSCQASIHDFRCVFGPTHTNLIFDVVVPHKFSLSDEEIQTWIFMQVQKENPTYFTVINVDRDFTNTLK